MNLQEFLDHKTECPVCGEKNLGLTFHSNRKQKHYVENGRYLVLFEMKGLKKQKDYYVGYSLNPTGDDFHIEFYTKDLVNLYDQVNTSLINRFLEFFDNLGAFRLYRTCNSCNKFNYTSGEFLFDFSHGRMSPIHIHSEYFGMASPFNQSSFTDYNIYRLSNFPTEKRSFLIYFHAASDHAANVNALPPLPASFMDLPLIQFVSSPETSARIKKLLVFS